MLAHSPKTIPGNQKTKDKGRRGRKVLSWPSGLYGLYGTTNSKTKGQEKKKTVLLWGKKKKHTVKNLYTSNQKGLIIYKTKRRQRGRRHDYNIYKKNHPKLPKEVMSMFDLGFLGVEKDFPKQKSLLPIKKERGCELTVEQKEYNHNHSTKRIVIEHAICRIKKYRIMNDIFRNRLRKYDKISDIVSGLVNYSMMNSC